MAAADVGDAGAAFELLDDAVERGQPLVDNVGLVAGPEEARDGAEYAAGAVAPADATAFDEGGLHLGVVADVAGRRPGIDIFRYDI